MYPFNFYIVLAVLFLCVLNIGQGFAQDNLFSAVKWTAPYPPTVFTKQITLQEDMAIGSPDVILLTPTQENPYPYWMAYAQGGTDTKGRLGMARSMDGVSWKRVKDQGTILEPSASGWDSHFLDTPCILKHGDVWYMWYFGSVSNDTVGGAIGLAISKDGIHFSKIKNNPVLVRGDDGEWDALWVESPSVAYDGRQFVMYYTGVGADWLPQIGRATSPDGMTWTKSSSNPVYGRENLDEWDSFAAAVPDVIFKDNHWELYFAGISIENVRDTFKKPQIGFAISTDGERNWQRLKEPIVTSELSGNQPNGPYNPSVLWDDQKEEYLMWYETGYGFGMAHGK